MNDREILDRFGEFIIKNIRDESIEYYDGLVTGHWKAPSLQSLQKELKKLNNRQKEIVRRCIISSIDAGLHQFLFALQEIIDFKNDIQIIVNGKNIAEISDGLAGELYSENGWYSRFSKYGDIPEED